ncbi:hypothetical protein DFQ26_002695 [Actinomortierella ambigua]|nr:hypothetical protein DFQ26_002695 [Actinomortierella ambigua]
MFRRCLKDSADLVYITAPHVVPIPTPSSIEEREEVQEQQQQENAADLDPENLPYGWWTRSPTNAYIGLDTTLTQLATVLKDQGPFDGVMGFSQGAALAALLQLLLERPDLSPTSDLAQQYRDHGPLGFSIIVSGFLPVDPVQLGWFRSRVPRSMNRLAAKEAAAAADVEKEGGAALPSRPSQNGLLGSKDDECQGVVGASLHIIGRGDVIIEPGIYLWRGGNAREIKM